ncbi:MAG: Gfo/Idh/MocA family protein [bacterium]
MKNSKIKLAIIGYGYWGPNLARNFNNVEDCEVSYVVDNRQERLSLVKKNYPAIKVTTNFEETIKDNNVDAVVIATPVFSHYEQAKKALNHGKHVMIEKPMTDSIDTAQELIELASKNNRILMVDHTFLYTGAVRKIKELKEKGELGKIEYIDSIRINLGLFQGDVNVLWDLAPHDISIINFILNEKPHSINTTGISHTKNDIENIVYLTMHYPSGLIAHINCSWSSPVKLRHMLIGGDKKMIVYNDLEPTEKVKVYNTGYEVKSDEDKRKLLVDYRTGDISIPKLSHKEALLSVAEDFVNSVKNNTRPISNGDIGLSVVETLEKASKSLKNNGNLVLYNS